MSEEGCEKKDYSKKLAPRGGGTVFIQTDEYSLTKNTNFFDSFSPSRFVFNEFDRSSDRGFSDNVVSETALSVNVVQKLIAEGLSTKDIAIQKNLSLGEVEAFLKANNLEDKNLVNDINRRVQENGPQNGETTRLNPPTNHESMKNAMKNVQKRKTRAIFTRWKNKTNERRIIRDSFSSQKNEINEEVSSNPALFLSWNDFDGLWEKWKSRKPPKKFKRHTPYPSQFISIPQRNEETQKVKNPIPNETMKQQQQITSHLPNEPKRRKKKEERKEKLLEWKDVPELQQKVYLQWREFLIGLLNSHGDREKGNTLAEILSLVLNISYKGDKKQFEMGNVSRSVQYVLRFFPHDFIKIAEDRYILAPNHHQLHNQLRDKGVQK